MSVLLYIFEDSLLNDLRNRHDILEVPLEMDLGSSKWHFICLKEGMEGIRRKLNQIGSDKVIYTWDKDNCALQNHMYLKLIRDLNLNNVNSLKFLYKRT